MTDTTTASTLDNYGFVRDAATIARRLTINGTTHWVIDELCITPARDASRDELLMLVDHIDNAHDLVDEQIEQQSEEPALEQLANGKPLAEPDPDTWVVAKCNYVDPKEGPCGWTRDTKQQHKNRVLTRHKTVHGIAGKNSKTVKKTIAKKATAKKATAKKR